MRCLSETRLTGHNPKLLLGAGPLDCIGVSQSSSLSNMVVRNIGFAAQQASRPISALLLCGPMTLGKSLPLLESQLDHPQHLAGMSGGVQESVLVRWVAQSSAHSEHSVNGGT